MEELRPPIYTIGYGSDEADRFVDRLKDLRIEYLVDVRSQPYSRRSPAYSKHVLEAILERWGIRYIFLGDSIGGRPSDPTCYVNERVDYRLVEQRPWYRAGIERLRDAWQQGHRVVLMCGEFDPGRCHRSRLIGRSLEGLGIPVQHVERDGELVSQEEVLERLTGGQASLFEE